MSKPQLPPEIEPATRRALAVGLYNHCWELLEIADRTAEQDAELIHAAHASRYHWGEIVDTPARLWRGEWMCARVYSVLGGPSPRSGTRVGRWRSSRRGRRRRPSRRGLGPPGDVRGDGAGVVRGR